MTQSSNNYEKLLSNAASLKDPAVSWEEVNKQAGFFKECMSHFRNDAAIDSFLKANSPFNLKYATAVVSACDTQKELKQKGVTPYQALITMICS